MKNLLAFLHSLGIGLHVNENSSPFLLFVMLLLVFAIISLLCFINIVIFLVIMYYSNDARILNIMSQNAFVFRIFNLYKNTRPYYVLTEFLFLIVNVSCIIWFCIMVILGCS